MRGRASSDRSDSVSVITEDDGGRTGGLADTTPSLIASTSSSALTSAGPATPSSVRGDDAVVISTPAENAAAANGLVSLLNRSEMYARLIGANLQKDRDEAAAALLSSSADTPENGSVSEQDGGVVVQTRTGRAGVVRTAVASKKKKSATSQKRKRTATTDVDLDKIVDLFDEDSTIDALPAGQPKLVTGAILKDYQLAGTSWLVSLYANGVNGILADEMGLGKTLQTISFIAHLIGMGVGGPFLVVAPLSVIANWVSEFQRFAPDIPVLLYHGTPQERADIRSSQLGLSGSLIRKGTKSKASQATAGKFSGVYPVIITSYSLIINDRLELSKLEFRLIVTDEAHRIKNFQCKLVQELKCYKSAQRLLLTGTPLHNNLTELWSLLSYIMPEIFDNVEAFKNWFDLSSATNAGGEVTSTTASTVSKLHGILKPFMLRRMKVDVEKNLPLKKEYILSAPLTPQQKALYDAVVARDIRAFLMKQKLDAQGIDLGSDVIVIDSDDEDDAKPTAATIAGNHDDDDLIIVETSATASTSRSSAKAARALAAAPPLRKRARKSYVEQEDEEYFQSIDDGTDVVELEQKSMEQIGIDYAVKQAKSSINNLKLNNLVMQLRKVCNHPYVFDWPIDPRTGTGVVNDRLLAASGKMLLLDRLLEGLFADGRKVLLFSQFTSQLDIIHAWANERKGWPVYRIDGSTKIADRSDQMKLFNSDHSEDACRLFLLSTRAGGVGITLTGADSVIIFDSDFNPQMDLQAMDRAHRIGQKNPVLVFRLVTANTIEGTILEKAAGKRKLETLIIGQGTFKMDDEDIAVALSGKRSKMAKTEEELLASIAQSADMITLAQEGDVILTDRQLKKLLDRSEDTMRSIKGWGDDADMDEEGGMVVKVAGESKLVEEELLDDESMFI